MLDDVLKISPTISITLVVGESAELKGADKIPSYLKILESEDYEVPEDFALSGDWGHFIDSGEGRFWSF